MRNRITLILFFTFIFSYAHGQELQKLDPDLSTMISGMLWTLGIKYNNDSNAVGGDTAIVSYIRDNYDSAKADMPKKEVALWGKYKDRIMKMLGGIYLIGDERPRYLHLKSDLPVRFKTFNNKTVLFWDVAFGFKYNSIKLSPDERFREIFEKRLTSIASEIVKSFKNADDINLFCVSMTYGVEDFSKDFNLRDSETILFLFTYNNAAKLENYSMTSDEFLSSLTTIARQNGSDKATKIKIK